MQRAAFAAIFSGGPRILHGLAMPSRRSVPTAGGSKVSAATVCALIRSPEVWLIDLRLVVQGCLEIVRKLETP